MILSLAGVAGLAAGCVERREYVRVYSPQPAYAAPDAVAAPNAPPAPQVEVVPVAPGPEYAWAPGYWYWNHSWVWMGGSWVIRPHVGAVWIGPRYIRHGRGYVWVRGHWR